MKAQELDKILLTAELKGHQYKHIIFGLNKSGVFDAIKYVTGKDVTNEDVRAISTTVMIGLERNGPENLVANILSLEKKIKEARPKAEDAIEAACKYLEIDTYNGSLNSLDASELKEIETILRGAQKKIRIAAKKSAGDM